MGQKFVHCDYQVSVPDDTRVYCRHTSVNSDRNLVPGVACRVCPQRTVPCADPRPVPMPDELLQIVQGDAAMPAGITQAWNLLGAFKDFVADGLRTVSKEEYEARLRICQTCDQRRGNRCLKCGCHLTVKAKGRAFKCPLKKWSVTDS